MTLDITDVQSVELLLQLGHTSVEIRVDPNLYVLVLFLSDHDPLITLAASTSVLGLLVELWHNLSLIANLHTISVPSMTGGLLAHLALRLRCRLLAHGNLSGLLLATKAIDTPVAGSRLLIGHKDGPVAPIDGQTVTWSISIVEEGLVLHRDLPWLSIAVVGGVSTSVVTHDAALLANVAEVTGLVPTDVHHS